MLKQYINNYLESLGSTKEELESVDLKSDSGYTFLIDDKYVCSVSDFIDSDNSVWFTVNLNEEPIKADILMDKFIYFRERLELTPFAGRANLTTGYEDNIIALSTRLDATDLNYEIFNEFMEILSLSVCYISGNDSISIPENTLLSAPEGDKNYLKLLDEAGIDENTLYANLNSLALDDFNLLLLYNDKSDTLRLCNTISKRIPDEELIGIMECNPQLNSDIAFTCTGNKKVGVEQSLDLKKVSSSDFYEALVKQIKIVDFLEKLVKDFSAGSREQSSYRDDLSKLLAMA